MGIFDILGAVGAGLGGAQKGYNQWQEQDLKDRVLAQNAALEREKLAQNQKQFDAGRMTDIGALAQFIPGLVAAPGTMVPTANIPAILQSREKQREFDLAQTGREAAAAVFERAGGARPSMLTGQLAPGEDPEAAALIPRTPNVLADPKFAMAAALARRPGTGGMAGVAEMMKVLFPDAVGMDKPHYETRPDGLYQIFPNGTSRKVEGVPGAAPHGTPPIATYMDYLNKGDREGAKTFLDSLRTVSGAQHPERPKDPATLDALIARAADPTVSAEDRARANTQAEAIIKGRTAQVRTTADIHADVSEGVKTRAEARKAEKGFASTATLLNQLEELVPAMAKKGFLAADSSSQSAAMAAARRSPYVPVIGKPGDEDLAAWRAHAGTMVSILRQLGDIGPRAIAAYQSAIDVIEHPTTAAAARKVFGQLREALNAAKTGEAGAGKGEPPYPGSSGVPAVLPPAPGVSPAGSKRDAIGPNGELGRLPADTDLSMYPGYRWK